MHQIHSAEMCGNNLVTPYCNLRADVTFGLKPAHIATHSHKIRRSRNKAQGPASRGQGSQYPKSAAGLIPKPLTFFKAHPRTKPSSASAPGALCTYVIPTLLSSGWREGGGALSASPEDPCTRQAASACPESA